MLLTVNAPNGGAFNVEIRKNSLKGEILGSKNFKLKQGVTRFENLKIKLSKTAHKENIFVLIQQKNGKSLQINSFSFLK